MPGVASVDVRPVTGSVVILHDGAFEPLRQRLAADRLLLIAPPGPPEPHDPIASMRDQLERTDGTIRRLTSGQADLSGAAFVALVAIGLVQLARGHVAGPAISLFGQAATVALLQLSRKDAAEPGATPPPD